MTMTATAPVPTTTGPIPTPPPARAKAPARPKAVRSERTAADPSPELRHRRNEIWMVAADPGKPAVGTEIWSDRPAIIVSNNVLNARAGFAQVVYLSTSTRKRSGPTHVLLPAIEGHGDSMALCEQIHTVDASRLRHKMGDLPASRVRDIDAALSISMNIGRPDTHSAFRKWEEHIKVHGIDLAAEIGAMAGLTADQRVEALTRALTLITGQRDSYRTLFEASQALPTAMHEVANALNETDATRTE